MIDAFVIGGGPAGSAVATRLASAGREIVLLERSTGPVDKVCGEFLSNEAMTYLAALGLDLPALGAVPIDAVRLCVDSRVAEVRLPFPAVSLSRRVLDEALLQRAAAAGVLVRRGAKVAGLARAGSTWSARLADGFELFAENAFLATGKHDLRTHRRPEGGQDDLVAFKMHWRLTTKQAAELECHVELALFQGGYAGLQPVEGGKANLCLLIRRRRLLALGLRWEGVLEALQTESPHLAARLEGAVPCGTRALAVSPIPYGYVRRHADALWRLGDQAVVIPSFAGDGMSIALHSADLAASIFLRGGDANEYQTRLARDVRMQVRLATVLSRALVCRPGQLALASIARMWPRLMATTAARTRISDKALARV